MARELAHLFDEWGRSHGWDWTDRGDPSDPGDFRPGGGGDPYGPGGPLNPNTLHPAPSGQPSGGGSSDKDDDDGADSSSGNKPHSGGSTHRIHVLSRFADDDDGSGTSDTGSSPGDPDHAAGWHGETFDSPNLGIGDLMGDIGFAPPDLNQGGGRGGTTGPMDTTRSSTKTDTVRVTPKIVTKGNKNKALGKPSTNPSTTPSTNNSKGKGYTLSNTNELTDSLARKGLSPSDVTSTNVDIGDYVVAPSHPIPTFSGRDQETIGPAVNVQFSGEDLDRVYTHYRNLSLDPITGLMVFTDMWANQSAKHFDHYGSGSGDYIDGNEGKKEELLKRFFNDAKRGRYDQARDLNWNNERHFKYLMDEAFKYGLK
jgi:hypothetical protein